MNQRKVDLGKTAKYLHARLNSGGLLPPSMRRGCPEYIKSAYWTTLNQRCINGAHFSDTSRNKSYRDKAVMLEMTKAQFSEWVDCNWAKFAALYAEGKTPSIDRINNALGYFAENMDVIDLKENMRKDRNKPVTRVDIFTGKEVTYESARAAEIDGYSYKQISRACIAGTNHKGSAWKFA